MEEESSFEELGAMVMERFMLSKVKVIQRWWRGVLELRQKRLDPIVFRRCNEEFEESMLFLHSSEVSPIKMIEHLNERAQDQVEERPDPLRLREEAAEQQLQTHLQLLQQLLEDRRITGETFFQQGQTNIGDTLNDAMNSAKDVKLPTSLKGAATVNLSVAATVLP